MKKVSWVVSFCMFLLLIGISVFLLGKNRQDLVFLSSISLSTIFLVVILDIFATTLAGMKINLFTKKFGINLKWKEWFGLACITTWVNYTTPFGGGTVVKGVYLKKKFGLEYKKFILLTGATFLIGFLVAGILGAVGIIASGIMRQRLDEIAVFFAVLMVVSLVLILAEIKINSRRKILVHLSRMIEGWNQIRKDYLLVLKVAFIELLSMSVMACRVALVFSVFRISAPFSFCIITAVFTYTSILLAITPAALGIKEGITSFLSRVWGYGSRVGLYASVVERMIALIWIIPSGIYFSSVFLKKHRKDSSSLHVSEKTKENHLNPAHEKQHH